ncbi:MAG: hypothetical protein SNJ54_01870 [Anaerolineae bacterium]
MRFVASLTRGASELKRMLALWQESGDQRNPFANVLVTPLFMPPSGMRVIRDWKEQGIIQQLYFDSGGYYVQMGRISYIDLYYPLLELYRRENWADWYVLPDHVPRSSDPEELVDLKVRDTIEYGMLFFESLHDDLKLKAIPVVHGYTHHQIESAIESHLRMKSRFIGFGSFDTSGAKGSVNKLSWRSYENLQTIIREVSEHVEGVHVFGVTTPPVLYLLHRINVFSFDSVGWMKSAGFGKVYMPFSRAYNITYFDPSSRSLSKSQFEYIKHITGHDCYFCRSFEKLHRERYYRIMHNIIVILDMLDALVLADDRLRQLNLIRLLSPDYVRLLEL